ncbi:hypothetical protein TSUD_322580 [Trifolium subterraneum]|uniref:Reverse transcriptase domain-containing protein n=1 Tax=Trifolium subterraneum TaxID=3900 RepID=A0A2Z6N4D6_TRISU|nr:hypothetical protein TSUD_322580 [Trifolium subterraneum]
MEEIRSLQRNVTTMEKEQAEQNTDSEDESLIESQPLRQSLWDSKVPDNFKSPHLPTFDGKTDPVEHLMAVGTQTAIIGALEHLRWKLLSGTLKDAALRWYMNLPNNSIESHADFHKKFIQQFSGTKHIKVTATSLFKIRQNYAETLREYLTRFNEATITVSNLNQEMFVAAFHNDLKAGHFNESLAQKPDTSMLEVIKRASCYIKGEESNAEKRSRDAKEKDLRNNNNKRQNSQPQRNWQNNDTHKQGYRTKPNYPPNGGGGMNYPQHKRYPAEREYTPLNRARVHVLHEILQTGLAPLPPPRINNTVMGLDTEACCAYHRCKGHDTERCFRLRDLIEDLIRSGHLRKFLEDAAKGQIALPKQIPYQQKVEGDGGNKGEKHRVAVNTISGGFAGGGESSSSRKRYVRRSSFEICSVGNSTFPCISEISFNSDDGRDIIPHDDDPLVIHIRHKPPRPISPPDSGERTNRVNMVSITDLDPGEEFQDRRVSPIEDLEQPSDMPGIDESVITHKLSISSTTKPVVQRKRKVGEERRAAITEEVAKLKEAGFIEEIKYPTWLANMVMVKKANGKWRMCVDFTDLNKACPKDSYPLPNIIRLIDGASGYKTSSFMDAYSSYNQIKKSPMDAQHTAFMSNTCNYFYNVMPFGLKNAGATYQRLMDRVFAEQIRKNLKVYIDDMVVKTEEVGEHDKDLADILKSVRMYNMRLNPVKCSFGVQAGKFLGFLLTHRGIEANPDKFQAIINMRSPTSVKEVQQLTGRITALSRFLSCTGEKACHFFATLRKSERGAIKSQALGDFVLELTDPPSENEPQPSNLSIDGSSNLRGSGVGVVLEGPEGGTECKGGLTGEARQYEKTRYLQRDVLPPAKDEATKIRKMAAWYTMERGFSAQMLLCVMRAGFYWPSLHDNAAKYVETCDKCQRYSNLYHAPGEPLKAGIRHIGGPGNKILLEEDYLQVWIAQVHCIGQRHPVRQRKGGGMLQRKGNPKHFHLCRTPSSQWASRVSKQSHPQSPKKKDQLKTRELGGTPPRNIVVVPHNTTILNKGTTFTMVYGANAMIPVEIQPSSWRRDTLTLQENNAALEESLDLLPELRENAHFREFYTKQRAARKYNTSFIPRKFKEGDLVLKRPMSRDKGGKLAANWEGPLRIREAFEGGAYRLETMEGDVIPEPGTSPT